MTERRLLYDDAALRAVRSHLRMVIMLVAYLSCLAGEVASFTVQADSLELLQAAPAHCIRNNPVWQVLQHKMGDSLP